MAIGTYFDKSTTIPTFLVQVDINSPNIQWINIGAGIWEVNFDNTYSFVDSSLLDGFTTQTFGDIGSVVVDNIPQTEVASLALVTTTEESFYFDTSANTLYLHVVDNDDPVLHSILLGVIYGFSYKDENPVNSDTPYEGRIESIDSVSISRDPLFFGKLSFPTIRFRIINADGYYDTFAEDNYLYGNQARILVGYNTLDISEYEVIHTGFIDNVSVSEDYVTFSIKDKRAQFSKKITYYNASANALDVIVDILNVYYNIPYNAAFYDITQWEAMEAVAPNITVDTEDEEVISIIENICNSVFGIFSITKAGLFTFIIIDTSASADSTIYSNEILNKIEVSYDPTEVLSSVEIGYDYSYLSDEYTYYTDSSREDTIYDKYKVYRTETFDTLLDTLSEASALAATILDYTQDVHGLTTLNLPFKFWNYGLGELIDVELNRNKTDTMFGTKKCEVISHTMDLDTPSVTMGLRIIE